MCSHLNICGAFTRGRRIDTLNVEIESVKEEMTKCELKDDMIDADVNRAPLKAIGDKAPSTQPKENAPASMDDDDPTKSRNLTADEQLPTGLTGGDSGRKAAGTVEVAQEQNNEKVASEKKAEHISTAEASGSFIGINHPFIYVLVIFLGLAHSSILTPNRSYSQGVNGFAWYCEQKYKRKMSKTIQHQLLSILAFNYVWIADNESRALIVINRM